MGALLLLLHYLSHPTGESAVYVAMPLWIPSHVLQFVAWTLLIPGLLGVYLWDSEKMGRLGFVAFILTFVAGMLASGAGLWVGAVFQTLYPTAADPGGPLLTNAGARLALDASQLWILTLFLFAASTLRVPSLPHFAAWLVILAVVLGVLTLILLPFGSTAQFYAADVAVAILAAGLFVWGHALGSEHKSPSLQNLTDASAGYVK